MLESTEGAIEKGQSREPGNVGTQGEDKTKQKHNTMFVWHHYSQTNTNNINKTWALWVYILCCELSKFLVSEIQIVSSLLIFNYLS